MDGPEIKLEPVNDIKFETVNLKGKNANSGFNAKSIMNLFVKVYIR